MLDVSFDWCLTSNIGLYQFPESALKALASLGCESVSSEGAPDECRALSLSFAPTRAAAIAPS
jgi:hypothetical protein